MITAENGLKSNILTPEQIQLFEDNIEKLQEEYKIKGSLSLDSLIPILGTPPKLIDSPDNDARDLAFEMCAEYGCKCLKIENLISMSIK